MNKTTFCAFLLIFLSAVPSTLGTFQKLTFSTSGFPCSVDSPSKVYPIEEISSVPWCVPSPVLCSWKCHMEPNCTGYNVNTAENQCQLYDYIPINFKINATCNFFQNKIYDGTCPSVKAAPDTSAFKLVPDQCCSFPFSLKGVIYYNCTKNVNSLYPDNIGCFVTGRIWAYCLPPTGFPTDYYNGSVIVPNNTQPVATVFIFGWFIIQKHVVDDSMMFNKSWNSYSIGFGDPRGEHYWFGNENLYRLTSTGNWKLRVEVEMNDTRKWYSAEYQFFQLSNEASGYVLNVSGYTGDAGDALNYYYAPWKAVGMKFSTFDKDRDNNPSGNCAKNSASGWWWNWCGVSGLNAHHGGYNTWGSTTRYVSRSRMLMKQN